MPTRTDGIPLLRSAGAKAIASLRLKHIDLVNGSVYQDARDVKTKFSKSFTTYFFPVGDDVLGIFADWVNYLGHDLGWAGDAPLFPSTRTEVGTDGQFHVSGMTCESWRSTAPIRAIFREAFTAAGLAYFNPHALRSTLTHMGEEMCRTPEEFKAWSQNFGHEKVLTTFTSYGAVASHRQGELIRNLANRSPTDTEDIKVLLQKLAKRLDVD